MRGSATTVVGSRGAVDAFVGGREVLHREGIGGLASVTVGALSPGERAEAVAAGLELSPVSLQQLIVRKTNVQRDRIRAERMTAIAPQTRPSSGRRPHPASRIWRVVRLNLVNKWTTIWTAHHDHVVHLGRELCDLVDHLVARPRRPTAPRRSTTRSTAAAGSTSSSTCSCVGVTDHQHDLPVRARLQRDPPRLLPRHLAHLRPARGGLLDRVHDAWPTSRSGRTDGASAATCSPRSTSATRCGSGSSPSSSGCCSASSSARPARSSSRAGG